MNRIIDNYSPVESTTTRSTGTGVEHNWDEIYRYGGYQTGWVCPICGQVNAPLMPFCTGDHKKIKGVWSTNTEAKECYQMQLDKILDYLNESIDNASKK